MRRLPRGNTLSAIILAVIILISTLSTAELYTLSQNSFVNGAPTKYYTITGYPSSTTAGLSFSGVTVTVYNSNGKVATGYTGKVYFTSTDPKPLCRIPLTASTPSPLVAKVIRENIHFQVSFLQPQAPKL